MLIKLADSVALPCPSQIQQSKWQSVQFTGDYKANLYTASLTLGNPDLIHGTGVAVLHYLRAVTKHISLGAEFAYQVRTSCGQIV